MTSPHSCHKEELIGVQRKPTSKELIGQTCTIVGFSVRALELSAKVCGLKTFAIDCFADMDLRRSADRFEFVNLDYFKNKDGKLQAPSAKYLIDKVKELKDVISNENYLIKGSGFENHPEYILGFEKFKNYIGNNVESVNRVRKLENLFNFFVKENIKFPKTIKFDYFESQNDIEYQIFDSDKSSEVDSMKKYTADEIFSSFYDEVVLKSFSLPIILKSEKTGGGFGIYLIKNKEQFIENLKNLIELHKTPIVLQEFISGESMSCSFISNGTEAEIIGFSKQIIGDKRFGCKNDFTYCGNIMSNKISDPSTKSNKKLTEKLQKIVNKIVFYSNLKGSNGIDFILQNNGKNSDEFEVYIIEINPRIQGTIDVFEAVTGRNIVEMHIKSIKEGLLPSNIEYPSTDTYIRAIYYSPLTFHIMVDLQGLNFRDVPLIGNYIEEGQPMCSSVILGCSEEDAYLKALEERNLLVKVLGLKTRIPENSDFLKK